MRHHHEAYNGTGFPDNLKGQEVPLGSRIIAIADTLDRLLSVHSLDRALADVKQLSGSRIDTQLLMPLGQVSRERVELFSAIQNVEEELHPDELQTGMVLSRDVRSGTGLLLINKGVTLNPRRIESLKRYYVLDPPSTGVYVSRNN